MLLKGSAGKVGRPPAEFRLMIEAVFYVLRTGCPWRDIPHHIYGPWPTVYGHWREWVEIKMWPKLLQGLARRARGRLRFVDATFCKVHQDGANPAGGQRAQRIGRTKGGLNTKVAALVDSQGRLVSFVTEVGQAHDLKCAEKMRDSMRRVVLCADKAFDSAKFDHLLRDLGSLTCIPRRSNHSAGGWRYFDSQIYKARHRIENFFGRIKRFRRIATRYEKLALTFSAFIALAAVVDWIRN